MGYSLRFLQALGVWQNGWQEDATRRQLITQELVGAIELEALPALAKQETNLCFRKRFLVPNNSQNGGDLVPLVLEGRIAEGVASWTTDWKVAENFKAPLREGNVSAIFAHVPDPKEVILNVKALWKDPAFEADVNKYSQSGGAYAKALTNFKSRQSEVILNAPLLALEIEAFCGRSGPFEDLCEVAGKNTEEEKDEFWKALVDAGEFPETPRWLSKPGAQRALAVARAKFLSRAT